MAKNYAGITDTGRQRNNNEDAFIAGILPDKLVTACVIDGLGGYEGGEIAAAIAREAITQTLSVAAGDIHRQLLDAMTAANRRIHEEKRKSDQLNHMACVATLAVVDMQANKFYYTHVGDTRLYLLRDHSLVKITHDQSFVGFLEDSNRISESEAMSHPRRNEINKALGFDADTEGADYFESGDSPFLPGDMLLLCSDGLSDMLSRAEIAGILNGRGSADEKAAMLVEAANLAGGHDNITVVLVQHEKRPAAKRAIQPPAQKKTAEASDDSIIQEEVLTINNPLKNRRGGMIVAGVMLFLLVIVAAWYFMSRQQQPKAVMPPPDLPQSNNAERTLADSLQSSALHEISVEQAADVPILISDTIFIDRDSLVLHGNGLKFRADSAYQGPAFVFGKNCRYVLLDSMEFQNFPMAIIAFKNILHLQAVRFTNCPMPVLYNLAADTTNPANNKSNILKKDSTPINRH